MIFLVFTILSFQLLSANLAMDRAITLDEENIISENSSLKVFEDIILHDYDNDRFLIVGQDSSVEILSYSKTKLDLPIPVKNPVMISDFVQNKNGDLIVTETNTNSIYKIEAENTLRKKVRLEKVPFYLTLYRSGYLVISNGLDNKYLSYYNSNFEKIHEIIIGASFFKNGIKSINKLYRRKSFFVESDTIYVKGNDDQHLICTINSSIMCNDAISLEGLILIGKSHNNGFFYMENEKIKSGTINEILESKGELILNRVKHAGYLYHFQEELYVIDDKKIKIYN